MYELEIIQTAEKLAREVMGVKEKEEVFVITNVTRMTATDVVFVPTTHAITHMRARVEASEAGTRIAILRGVDEDMMIRGAMIVDFPELRKRTEKEDGHAGCLANS